MTIRMMGEFKVFPEAPDVIITVGQKEAGLRLFLGGYLEVEEEILQLWLSKVEF